MAIKHEKVFVAGDKKLAPGLDSEREDCVVVGIPANFCRRGSQRDVLRHVSDISRILRGGAGCRTELQLHFLLDLAHNPIPGKGHAFLLEAAPEPPAKAAPREDREPDVAIEQDAHPAGSFGARRESPPRSLSDRSAARPPTR